MFFVLNDSNLSLCNDLLIDFNIMSVNVGSISPPDLSLTVFYSNLRSLISLKYFLGEISEDLFRHLVLHFHLKIIH